MKNSGPLFHILDRLSGFLFYSAFLLVVLLPPHPSRAATADNQDMASSAATRQQAKTEEKPFEYVIGNRKDPFMPFISKKAVTKGVDMNEIVEPSGNLTGMQLFEPGQLTLVALVKAGSKDLAMVQDNTGKGYVITIGTKIGRFGVVKDITSNQVVIEETKQTRAGRQIVTHTAMVLKKEGEN